MFVANKYKRIYDQLVLRAQGRRLVCYTEEHHILPRSLGGDNSVTNRVRLTAREHFIAHLCLFKCAIGHAQYKMALAAGLLAKHGRSSRVYQALRENVAATMQGNTRRVGMQHTDDSRKKISISMKGKALRLGAKHSAESIAKMRNAHLGNTGCAGRIMSPETRARISAAQKARWELLKAA